MKRTAPAIRAWSFALVYAGFIFYLSSLSRPLPESVQKYFSDWVLHGVEYGFFGVLLSRAFAFTWPERPAPRHWLSTVSWGVLYALSDEWHQRFVPNRQSSAHDVAADAIGLALGAFVWIWIVSKSGSDNA